MYKKFVAVDQYKNIEFVDHPRKELCQLHGTSKANKLYRDIDGKEVHVGYAVKGHWYEVMRLSPLDKSAE